MSMDNNGQPMPFRQHLSEPVGPALKTAFNEFIDRRTALGVKKYGEPLHSLNGRDCVEDAIEELLDFTQYQQQRILELKTALTQTRGELDRVRADYERGLVARTRATDSQQLFPNALPPRPRQPVPVYPNCETVDSEVLRDLLEAIDCCDAHADLWYSNAYTFAANAIGKPLPPREDE